MESKAFLGVIAGVVGFYFAIRALGFRIVPAQLTDGPGKCYDHEKPHAIFNAVETPENLFVGDFYFMELKEGQKFTLDVTLKTRRGNAAAIEPGSARFTSSDPSVVTVFQDPTNELRATVEGVDGSANESVVIEFRADGDRGEAVREVVGTLDVVCTQGNATVVELTAGTPVDSDFTPTTPDPLPDTETPTDTETPAETETPVEGGPAEETTEPVDPAPVEDPAPPNEGDGFR